MGKTRSSQPDSLGGTAIHPLKTLILTIGNEVASGHTINGNAAYIARQLESVGVTPERVLTLRDDLQTMVREMKSAIKKFDVIVITGGLGPTHDDITKPALAKLFKVGYYRDESILADVRSFFKNINTPMPSINDAQADVPVTFIPLRNRCGTAPGLYKNADGCHLFALPGVPSEMRHLMTTGVLPILQRAAPSRGLARVSLRTAGIGESPLIPYVQATGILDDPEVEVAFLPNMGQVDLRLTVYANTQPDANKKLATAKRTVMKGIAPWYFGADDETLESALGKALRKQSLTIAAAESCTGGLFSSLVTSVAGSSTYFAEGVVTYSNEAKIRRCGVREQTLIDDGAVSDEVAAQMAVGIAQSAGTDIGISATGIAGPTGGTKAKPVGLVYIGVWVDGVVTVHKKQFGTGDRKRIQLRTTQTMILLLLAALKERNAKHKKSRGK